MNIIKDSKTLFKKLFRSDQEKIQEIQEILLKAVDANSFIGEKFIDFVVLGNNPLSPDNFSFSKNFLMRLIFEPLADIFLVKRIFANELNFLLITDKRFFIVNTNYFFQVKSCIGYKITDTRFIKCKKSPASWIGWIQPYDTVFLQFPGGETRKFRIISQGNYQEKARKVIEVLQGN